MAEADISNWAKADITIWGLHRYRMTFCLCKAARVLSLRSAGRGSDGRLAATWSQKVNLVVKAPVEGGTDKVEPAIKAVIDAKPSAVIAILPVSATGAFVRGGEANNALLVYGPSYTESGLLVQAAGPSSEIRKLNETPGSRCRRYRDQYWL
jgi:hypothetical protein